MLDSVERYIRGEMKPDERLQFEKLGPCLLHELHAFADLGVIEPAIPREIEFVLGIRAAFRGLRIRVVGQAEQQTGAKQSPRH